MSTTRRSPDGEARQSATSPDDGVVVELDLRDVEEVEPKRSTGLVGDVEELGRLAASALDQGQPPGETWTRLMASVLIDAALTANSAALHDALKVLQHADSALQNTKTATESDECSQFSGTITALAAVAHWGARRSVARAFGASIARGSHAERMLSVMAAHRGVTNRELAEAVGVSESEVSRTGRRLLKLGLAVSKKLGRSNAWSLTPRGKAALGAMGCDHHHSSSSPQPDVESINPPMREVNSVNELVEAASHDDPALVRLHTPTGADQVYERHSLHHDAAMMIDEAPELPSALVSETAVYMPVGESGDALLVSS